MNAVSSVGANSQQGSQVVSSGSELGKQDFLNLLVTQLANQDPMNPMDNQQFAAQLAQFSTLEMMTNIQGTLEESLLADHALAGAIQGGMATDLIGKQITALDDRVVLAGEDATLRWEAEDGVASLEAVITNSLGVVVRRMTIAPPDGASATWDGRDDAGAQLPDGTYTVSLSATDEAGAALSIRPLWQGRVDTVRFREGVPWLVSGGIEFSLGQISELSQGGQNPEDGTSPSTETHFNW